MYAIIFRAESIRGNLWISTLTHFLKSCFSQSLLMLVESGTISETINNLSLYFTFQLKRLATIL